VIDWYWIIGSALAGWTFLTIMARESQSRLQTMEAEHAAAQAAKAAAAVPSPSHGAVTTLR
jgi:hypothetical protein